MSSENIQTIIGLSFIKLILIQLISNNFLVFAQNITTNVESNDNIFDGNKTTIESMVNKTKPFEDMMHLMPSAPQEDRLPDNETSIIEINESVNYFDENLNTILFLGIILSVVLLLVFIRYKALHKDDHNITDTQINGRTVIDTTGFQDVPLHSSQSLPSITEHTTNVYSIHSSHNNYWPTTQTYFSNGSKDNCVELPPSYESVTNLK